jgi:hypothetical protein
MKHSGMSRNVVSRTLFYGLALIIGLFISSGQPLQIRIVGVSLAVMVTFFSRMSPSGASTEAQASPVPTRESQVLIQSPAILVNLFDHVDHNLLSAALTLDDRQLAPLRANDPSGEIDLVA